MTKEKMKFTKQDIYVRNGIYTKIILGVIMLGIWEGTSTFLANDLIVRIWITVAVAGGWFIAYLELCAKRIEIHGATIIYRDYLWRTKQYSIQELDRIVPEKKKHSKAIVLGNDGKELFSFHSNMEEACLALYYLEHKGVKLVQTMQCSMTYRKYYNHICGTAVAVKDKYYIKVVNVIALRISMKRLNYWMMINGGVEKKLRRIATKNLSRWEIKNTRLKDGLSVNQWRINRKYEIIVTSEEHNETSYIKFWEHCRKNGLAIREALLTKEGRLYVRKDGFICEVKERFDYPSHLYKFVKKKRRCKSFCYQAGENFAKHQSLLNKHPRFIKKEEFLRSKEKRIQAVKYIPDQYLSKKDWRKLQSEVNRSCSLVKKEWVTRTDEHAILIKRKRLLLSEYYLELPAEYDVVQWRLCNYMAIVAKNAYVDGKRLSPKRWYEYVEQMMAGYESVRSFTKEERACINPCLRLAIALQMAEQNENKKCKRRLVKLYQFLET